MQRQTLFAGFSLCLAIGVLASTGAGAEKVDLVGASATTTGSQKIKIDGFGACTRFIGFDADFVTNRDFTGVDDQAIAYSGRYKQQKKKQGRKIRVKLSRASKKNLKRGIKEAVRACTGESRVSVSIQSLKVRATVAKALDTLRIKLKARVKGKAGGERGEATYSFKSSGPLVLAGM